MTGSLRTSWKVRRIFPPAELQDRRANAAAVRQFPLTFTAPGRGQRRRQRPTRPSTAQCKERRSRKTRSPRSGLGSAGIGSAGVGAAHRPGIEPRCGASKERGVRGVRPRGARAWLGAAAAPNSVASSAGPRYRPGPAATARRSPWRPPPVLPHLGRGARPRKTKVTLRLTLR